ncbi:fungal protein [Schizosaccharomyces japonicus yFS275]|uniref:Fungal protein n=1 Tax=Schizosaccharomyces japonicus (strain yFS275 / FY16936) TaxID=402676 RepID=B6JW33_SCHJY|nr:fungal protein [Schizosaccharomyces japonicus yFS275]EEB05584.1 fungal protein [Schizosaccharomyces japonicus yFS275]
MDPTGQELTSFAASHFGPSATKCWDSLFLGPPNEQPVVPERYPDGTIRTLTDEQIQYFRESELRHLRWEKELAQEREELRRIREAEEEASANEPRTCSSVEETPATVPIPATEVFKGKHFQVLKYRAHELIELEQTLDNNFRKQTATGFVKYWPVLPMRN